MFKANTATDAPENYKDIFNQNDTEYWEEAVKEEFHSIEENKEWQVVDTLPSSKLLKSMWVFRHITLKPTLQCTVVCNAKLLEISLQPRVPKNFEAISRHFLPLHRLSIYYTYRENRV